MKLRPDKELLIQALGESADAMCILGILYEHGLGVRRDPETAWEWTIKAAELDSTLAMYYAALTLEAGAVVPRDAERAYSLALTAKHR